MPRSSPGASDDAPGECCSGPLATASMSATDAPETAPSAGTEHGRQRVGPASPGRIPRRAENRGLGDACAVAGAGVRAEMLRRWALCQPVFVGVAHGLGAISGAGLVEDPVDVGLDGCVAEDELVGDFAVRQTESD